jgi:hypothetical protein
MIECTPMTREAAPAGVKGDDQAPTVASAPERAGTAAKPIGAAAAAAPPIVMDTTAHIMDFFISLPSEVLTRSVTGVVDGDDRRLAYG